MNYSKYKAFPIMRNDARKWPSNVITSAPIWCSVDLRDGNQALVTPMNLQQKLDFFEYLVKIGFKEIEIGCPAASDTEFQFTRALIEQDMLGDDVVIQVLTQSIEHIIRKTFEALDGAKKAVIHLYNSTSTLQRDVVFNKDKKEIIELAVSGAKLILELAEQYGRERFIFEYSPESFTGTEMDYAAEICNAVLEVWHPTPENKVIINLPSTVEMATPNVYADQIEYMCANINYRENVIISLHAHNDRGTAVAATELALMAGADRVEGTLFGNGERTGNADIMNIAMNMYTQGIDPKLDFSAIDEAVDIYEKSTSMLVHPRHPYAGELVYTAFSGTHQDAIKKGMARVSEHPERWEVPYLPIDPVDVGRTYAPIIRINSQSGKSGAAYVLEQNFGLRIPKRMQQNFGGVMKKASDEGNKELLPDELYELFDREYVNLDSYIELVSFNEETNGESRLTAEIKINKPFSGKSCGICRIEGTGNGIVDAFCKAVNIELGIEFEIIDYNEHSMEYGSRSRAITYMEIKCGDGNTFFGAGVSSSISKSSIRAIISAVNKSI